jgi:hypothetical protein
VVLGYLAKPIYILFAFGLGQTLLPWRPLAVVAGVVVVVILAFAVGGLRDQREAAAFLASCFVLPVGIGTLLSDPMPRYYLFVAPLFYMALAAGITAVPRPTLRVVLGSVLVITWGVAIGNYYANRDFHILAHVSPWREVGQFLKANRVDGDVMIHVALKPFIPTEPLTYYAGSPIPIYGEEVRGELPRLTRDGTARRVWLIVSESTLQAAGQATASWLAARYGLCREQRYYHDPDYQLKKRFFRKDFAEYRIRVYRFEGPDAHGTGTAVCQSSPGGADDRRTERLLHRRAGLFAGPSLL